MNVEEHARRFDERHYMSLPVPQPYDPMQVWFPSPDFCKHMGTLRDLAAKAERILELGPDYGIGSTAAIRQGFEANTNLPIWVSVDIVDHMIPWLKPAHRHWHFIIGSSTDQSTVNRVEAICSKFDLLFIDTVHTKDHLAKELELWSPLASDNATWLFHDVEMLGQYNPMTDAIKEFCERDKRWEYSLISKESNGLGAMVPV